MKVTVSSASNTTSGADTSSLTTISYPSIRAKPSAVTAAPMSTLPAGPLDITTPNATTSPPSAMESLAASPTTDRFTVPPAVSGPSSVIKSPASMVTSPAVVMLPATADVTSSSADTTSEPAATAALICTSSPVEVRLTNPLDVSSPATSTMPSATIVTVVGASLAPMAPPTLMFAPASAVSPN